MNIVSTLFHFHEIISKFFPMSRLSFGAIIVNLLPLLVLCDVHDKITIL